MAAATWPFAMGRWELAMAAGWFGLQRGGSHTNEADVVMIVVSTRQARRQANGCTLGVLIVEGMVVSFLC